MTGCPRRRRPTRLRAGDRVALVAPASPLTEETFAAGAEILRAWGLDVTVGAHALGRHPTFGYLSGTDSDRAEDFHRAWCDPDVAAVFCARGGYGALRMVDLLDWDAMAAAAPKVFAGSSDITALHDVLRARLDLVTLFAPMVGTAAFVADEAAREQLRRTLFEPESALVLTGPDAETLVGGTAGGELVGGNVSLLVSALGVPGLPLPPAGAIAVLEDCTEEPYRIDHFVTHLLRAGWFDEVAGVALGSWDRCGDREVLREVLTDRLTTLGIPVVWELGFGHGPGAQTIPLGARAHLDADAATLTLDEPALR